MSYGNSPGGPGDGNAGQEPQGDHGGRPYWGPAGPTGRTGPAGQAQGHGYGVPPSGATGQQAGYGAPPTGVTVQQAGYGVPLGSPPPTYLRWGIAAIVGGVLFSMIGGVPTGLASTHFARKVMPRWQAGDQQGALDASRKARTWAIVSTVLDVLGFIFVIYLFSNSRTGTVG